MKKPNPLNTKYYILHTPPQAGQMVLIIILVMVVVLTIGLSLIARTTSDIKMTERQDRSARAFSAAEAGIEEALRTGVSVETPFLLESGASFTTNVTGATGLSGFTFPDRLQPGEVQPLWLVNHNESDGTIDETAVYKAASVDLCWEGAAALGAAIFYKDAGVYKVARGAYDPDDGRRGITGNGFSAPDSGTCSSLGMVHIKKLNFAEFGINPVLPSITLLFIRVRPYYDSAKIGFAAAGGTSGTFPSQGKEIVSIGTYNEITRKVRVFRGWLSPPAVFDFALFSGGSLTK